MLGLLFLCACAGPSADEQPQPVKTVKKVVIKKQAQLPSSELALLMRKMYAQLKIVGYELQNNQPVTDSLLVGFERIHTAKATTPEEINATFHAMADVWLNELQVFKEHPVQENYNAVMNACVNCHQSFCPGPIKKIQRLIPN